MQLNETPNNFQQQVLERLDKLTTDVEKLSTDVEKLDYKFDTYQKVSDQVVRLATTIIVAAASVGILSPVL